MRRLALSLLLLTLATRPAAAGMAVSNGSLRINGGSIRTDTLDIRGTLAGNGTFSAPVSRLAGVAAPCGEYEAETGTLLFEGAVEFDGTYACAVNGHGDVDLIRATGPVSGTAAVQVVKLPDAIPLGQVILQGSADTSWTGFSLSDEQQGLLRFDFPAPGQLALTDLMGDSDSDHLPDWWEFAFYTNRTLALPGDDDDGDRSSNLTELGAGTHPRDPASVLAIVQVDSVGGHRLRWNSVAGKTYTVRSAPSLDGEFTLQASGLPATAPIAGWTHIAPPPYPLFYQVLVDP